MDFKGNSLGMWRNLHRRAKVIFLGVFILTVMVCGLIYLFGDSSAEEPDRTYDWLTDSQIAYLSKEAMRYAPFSFFFFFFHVHEH